MSVMLNEHDYLKQHNVVQLFDELTAALLNKKPEEPTGFIIDWLKTKCPGPTYKINTSNENKFKEFQRMFAKCGANLEATKVDLDEIDAAPELVVAHKATAVGEGVIVEDTQLDVEGADVGVNVRWLMDKLDQYEGRGATWTVLMGIRKGSNVEIFRGVVKGKIVKPRVDSNFGFDPIFQPEGRDKTLAEDKPDDVNARWFAIENLVKGKVYETKAPIEKWDGPWQKH
jgi:XTP/dITP diphosphohydrolase|uniref:Uncharacterized protein n=1 Tax=Eutreptiella gymnastica TaxID=73025 RepID=A0A7S4LLT3_9EUGL|mmetsp:Transcript_34812/g.58098  ORF Transcript_34812/g.58098 Transcript_34812/m.58098 type:complete len:228 (+) Transcript_34812:99-782(+)